MPPASLPDFSFESRALARGPCSIAGVDEVGRGPLAGPVVAAAVILRAECIPSGLNDSKQLTAKRRQELNLILRDTAIFGIGLATVEEIDALNILNASLLAMKRAVAALPVAVDHLLVDGNRLPPDLPCAAEAIVGGDACCLSIAAASIVAKVERDRIMVDLAQQHPGYGWETNAGYPTADHRAALEKLGVTAAHRRSFRPVYNILYQDISVSA